MQVEVWETQIAAKLGDLGGACNVVFNTNTGLPSLDQVSAGSGIAIRVRCATEPEKPPTNEASGGTMDAGRNLLAHLAQAQRVRACFEEAVHRIQKHWHARLSQMGETVAARLRSAFFYTYFFSRLRT